MEKFKCLAWIHPKCGILVEVIFTEHFLGNFLILFWNTQEQFSYGINFFISNFCLLSYTDSSQQKWLWQCNWSFAVSESKQKSYVNVVFANLNYESSMVLSKDLWSLQYAFTSFESCFILQMNWGSFCHLKYQWLVKMLSFLYHVITIIFTSFPFLLFTFTIFLFRHYIWSCGKSIFFLIDFLL